jgi:mannose-6-phosphate isomerase
MDLGGQTQIGEAVLTFDDARAIGGRFDGESLRDLIARDARGLLGPRGLELGGPNNHFPLLVKLIDAVEPLSIQIHPNDSQAPTGHLGKTEAWYILASAPGAHVFAGLREHVTFADIEHALTSGNSIVHLLRSVPVRAGEVIFVPAGTIHALGAGIVLYEVQQPSFVTYRLEDWGRSREMHVREGLAVLDEASRPVPQVPSARRSGSPVHAAVQCNQFAFEVLQVGPGDALILGPESGPQVFTCIEGDAELSSSHADVSLAHGSTAVLFANVGPARVTSLTGATVLRAWI